MEYDFKTVYKTFDVSYFSNDKNLLNNNLVDSQELKNYESIEKSTEDLIVILIKKFKLRISARKNRKFSRHIFISDDYNFDPNILKYDDSIKIAIVKDNLDKWSYLSNYDYIFTFKEHVKELKEYEHVYKIENQTTFAQIKFILNNLHKRKLNKFHYFIKEVEFQRVFPKTNDYFKVLNSDNFDDQWYKDTYGLKDNTDSVIHYLLIGYEKGYNPGPNFSAEEYYECNPDVKNKRANPLLHYERYGREENRFVSFEDRDKRGYDSILNSPFFDKDWYERTYELGDDVDSVDHYLHEGFVERYNPGPDFSTQEYYELNWAVKESGMNPLVHYELFGRKEDINIHLSDERHEEDYALILNSPFFDKDWYESTYDLNGFDDSVIHYLNVGYAKGNDPGPDFSTSEYFEYNGDVKLHGMNPLLHYERYGREENRFVSFEDREKRSYDSILNSPFFDKDWYERTYELGDDVDSVDHYLHEGFVERYNPGPDFSTQEYYELNWGVKKSGMNPLVHYEIFGRKQNLDIHFSDERSKENHDLILNSPFFDKDWYERTYDLDGFDDSVIHYLNVGYVKGNDPGPDFSTSEYFEYNGDVKLHGMNPLLHYEMYGRKESRFVSFEDKEKRGYDSILNSPFFDKDWYERTYELGDDVDSVDHYLHEGFVERYNPGPDFSTQEYYELNWGVKKSGMNPLVHYEIFGRKQNLDIHLSDERHEEDYALILNSPFFDKDWYERTYDLDGFDDSVIHYLNVGYAKGNNPGPDFSTSEYFECNEDVKLDGMNPLLHYERFGRNEKRNIHR